MLNDTYRLLASVAVVRELYDAGKGVYDVLQEFISDIIVRRRLFSFTSAQLTEYLNKDYSFQLSESVIKTCLRRMSFEKSHGEYKCCDLEKYTDNIAIQIEESEQNNKILFSKLYSFIENRTESQLSEENKLSIKHSFCDFLLQESLGILDSYIQYFHEFILSVENDLSMMEILRNVKEGTLIYEGIRYSSNISETGSWNTKLCLVLDTEILFAICGYNSALYQELYGELDKYLKEINKGCMSNSPKIKLCYFSETKKEIDSYFERAERIVRGLDHLDPTKEAMGQIVNQCVHASDVQMKRTLFYENLRKNNIDMIEYDFYNSEKRENMIYNLEDKSIYEKYSALWNEREESVHRSLVCLSHINILRKGKSSNGFENCEYIFLTATGRTLKLSRVPEVTMDGQVPFATTFDFLINRFWFKLNKGFGINRTPRTMDMVMRARHILSAIINSKASEKYDELKMQYENAKISKEEFCALNNELRSQLKMPEEIEKDSIGSVIDDLDRWNFEEVCEQHKKKELELDNAKHEIIELKEEIDARKRAESKLQIELTEAREEVEILRQQHIDEKEINLRNMDAIATLRADLAREQDIREKNERKREKRKRNIICFSLVFLLICGLVLYIWGCVNELVWAKIVSLIIELSAIISWVCSKIKKLGE